MNNEEMHQLTFQALCKAASVLSADELAVLCHHAGIAAKDVLEAMRRIKAARILEA